MSGSHADADQVELIGPVAGAFTYAMAAGLLLAGPVSGLASGSFWNGLCPALITLPLGIALAVQTRRWRRTARRFRAVGIPATAEIIAVRIRKGGENLDAAELRFRISGPGLDTVKADCEVPAGVPHPRVGDRHPVVVDPADNTFAIGYDHLFDQE